MSAVDDPYRDTQNLQWELLGNCVFEDAQMLFEARDAVRAHFPEMDDRASAQLTTQLVRDLLSGDLVYLRRCDSVGGERGLTLAEADAVLTSDAWTCSTPPETSLRSGWQRPAREWRRSTIRRITYATCGSGHRLHGDRRRRSDQRSCLGQRSEMTPEQQRG